MQKTYHGKPRIFGKVFFKRNLFSAIFNIKMLRIVMTLEIIIKINDNTLVKILSNASRLQYRKGFCLLKNEFIFVSQIENGSRCSLNGCLVGVKLLNTSKN
jgi:hypothetical protein